MYSNMHYSEALKENGLQLFTTGMYVATYDIITYLAI